MHDLTALSEVIRGHRVFIQTHNFPDPDAIGSAFGLQRLLKHFSIEAQILYVGKIDKFSTSLMVTTLQINMINLNDINDMSADDYIVIVDAQKHNANIFDCPGNEVACIDHHPIYIKPEYAYYDIRPEAGACSSMIAEYYFNAGITPDQTAATALLYGIKTDTLGLSRGVSELDIDMFYKLYKLSDISLLQRIQSNTMEFADLTAYTQAITGMEAYENVAFARIIGNCPDALIASVSDFLLALVEIEIVVVYAVRQDGIKLSVRSEVPSYDAGLAVKKALDGIGNGGGHAEMAGGFIPNDNYNEQVHAVLRGRFLKVFSDMGCP